MSPLFHDSRTVALECLLELVDAPVGHGQLLVLLDLLGGLGRDAVHSRARGVHLGLHGGRGLVPSLRVVDGLSMPWHMILIVLILVYIVRLLLSQTATIIIVVLIMVLHRNAPAHLHLTMTLDTLACHLVMMMLLSLHICQHLFQLGRLFLLV